MKSTVRSHSPAGFGLTELLMVIGVIGIMAGMAIPAFAGIWDRGASTKNRRNAQTLVTMFAAARSAGATFTEYSKTAVTEVLSGNTAGSSVMGRGIFATTQFLVALSREEVDHALAYVDSQGEGENFTLSLKAR